MTSKRFKKLPEKTKDLSPELMEKLLVDVKKIVLQNLMSQLICLSRLITNKKKVKLTLEL